MSLKVYYPCLPDRKYNHRFTHIKGDENASRALANEKQAEKQQRMAEALEKRKREAEERRGALGRQLDSERRKHQAENSKFYSYNITVS